MTVQTTLDFVNVEEFTVNQKIPEKVLRRGTDEVWQVCRVPLDQATVAFGPPAWAFIRDGQLIRIPLVPYTTDADGATSVAAAIERGLSIGQLVYVQQQLPVRVHIIVGRPVEQLVAAGDTGLLYRFWLGFAIRTS